MKITVNTNEDAELRAFIKDLIRGQVKSIARDEIRGIVKEVFEDKLKSGLNVTSAESMVKSEISKLVTETLVKKTESGWSSPTWLQQEARAVIKEEIQKALKDGKAI